jgi:hydrogenase-4 component F
VSDRTVLAMALVTLPALLAGILSILPRRCLTPVAVLGGLATATLALVVAGQALADPTHQHVDSLLVLDAPGGLLVGVIGAVGVVSVIVSPAYLASTQDAQRHHREATTYYVVLFAFWAVLLAVPLAGNLAAAWLLVEATTAASALLVGFSRKARALEAGWKYLILTSLGLGVALLGIALLASGIPATGLAALSWRELPTYTAGPRAALVTYVLLLAGLAAKIGWAPVHNWLPDAHSEAPAPVSAMLSAALLPAVMLIAWRCQQGLVPVVGAATSRTVLISFGLASIAVAVPFLARPQAWKRLLAYSSLEHMGVLALGLGFATPLALAGAAVHVVAHAIAKTLGFCAHTPLLGIDPQAAGHAVTGVGRRQPVLGASIAIAVGTLSGVPPSPIFISELLILAGGLQAHQVWLTAIAALLLALAFLALTRNALEMTLGDAQPADVPDLTAGQGAPARSGRLIGLSGVTLLTVVSTLLLLALTAIAIWLPSTDLPRAIAEELR